MAVIWNVIPWWNGTRKISTPELQEGVNCVLKLISLLPKLRAVVMVGARAAAAKPFLKTTGLELFSSDHTGPMVRARWRKRWEAIPGEWAKVCPLIIDDVTVNDPQEVNNFFENHSSRHD